MTQSILPAASVGRDLESLVTARAEERMIAPARSVGFDLRLLGATVLPQGQVICRTQHGTWFLSDHWDDPSGKDYAGQIPIPAEQRARLEALADAGVKPDHVWLAHELPPDWKEGDKIERLVPAPAPLRERDDEILRAVRTVVDVGLRAAGAAAALPLALGQLAVGLDPIVLGGVEHPEHPVVAWAALAYWHWD